MLKSRARDVIFFAFVNVADDQHDESFARSHRRRRPGVAVAALNDALQYGMPYTCIGSVLQSRASSLYSSIAESSLSRSLFLVFPVRRKRCLVARVVPEDESRQLRGLGLARRGARAGGRLLLPLVSRELSFIMHEKRS